MNTPPVPARVRSRDFLSGGFSLIELLAVVAMISVLCAAVASQGFSDQTPADMRNSLVSLSTQIELARQTAVSENTYAYVALTTPVNAGDPCYVASFAAPDGVDALPAFSVDISDGVLRPLSRVVKLPHVAVEDNVPTESTLILPAGSQALGNGSLPAITMAASPAGPLTFDRIIKFTPQGLAMIYESPVEWIRIVIVPSRNGVTGGKLAHQTSAITVAGLTGRVFFHRP